MAHQIAFKELTRSDLPLLHKWLAMPHVQKWWGNQGVSYNQIEEKYLPRIRGDVPVICFFIQAKHNPIGFIQTYWLCDYPDNSKFLDVDDGAASIDFFIGEPDFLQKGFGSLALWSFLDDVVFGTMLAQKCILGPDPSNLAAIKTYNKVGFRYLRTIEVPGEKGTEREYLMQIEKDELKNPIR